MKTGPHIAVNTRFLMKDKLEGMGRFTWEIVRRMVQNHPEARFSFFFDRPFDPSFIPAANVKGYHLPPPARHPILFRIWFDWSVTRMLRKLKPDVFFSPDGFLSLRTRVPQVAVFHDLAFMHYPQDVKPAEAAYYHKFFPQFSHRARKIITVSEYTRQDVIAQFREDPDKISVVYNACSDIFFPVSEQEKAEIRARFSEGKPFFHFVGAIHPRKNLNNLIEGFNLFKQKTGLPHRLLLVGRKAWDTVKVIHSYAHSDYKEDIHFTGYVSDLELNQLYGASEALCYVPYFEGFGLPLVEAMQAETAILCSNVTSMPEVAGEAACLVDPLKPSEIAAGLEKISTDPGYRAALIHKGRERKSAFSWDSSAAKVWEILKLS
ncbi:MAG: glycosyltransferase family 4 protein [Bacteroidia bacterium]|nr:glycosyltransferase family 4 protein [Bacteroidia bacterium]